MGNDGPVWGTQNSPADELAVIGVGGYDHIIDGIAPFSSRGMTTWSLPMGVGRPKPDVITMSVNLHGATADGYGCCTLSGTSVASPVVAGVVALLASAIPPEQRASLLNPGTMKQLLLGSARRLSSASIFSQGAGLVDLVGAASALRQAPLPTVTVHPSLVDFTECPYFWPYCKQPLYHTGAPVAVNLTVVNGHGPAARFKSIEWAAGEGRFIRGDGRFIQLLWPWTGWISLWLSVKKDTNATVLATGRLRILLSFLVEARQTSGGASQV